MGFYGTKLYLSSSYNARIACQPLVEHRPENKMFNLYYHKS